MVNTCQISIPLPPQLPIPFVSPVGLPASLLIVGDDRQDRSTALGGCRDHEPDRSRRRAVLRARLRVRKCLEACDGDWAVADLAVAHHRWFSH
jgi:hypothetical protein